MHIAAEQSYAITGSGPPEDLPQKVIEGRQLSQIGCRMFNNDEVTDPQAYALD